MNIGRNTPLTLLTAMVAQMPHSSMTPFDCRRKNVFRGIVDRVNINVTWKVSDRVHVMIRYNVGDQLMDDFYG